MNFLQIFNVAGGKDPQVKSLPPVIAYFFFFIPNIFLKNGASIPGERTRTIFINKPPFLIMFTKQKQSCDDDRRRFYKGYKIPGKHKCNKHSHAKADRRHAERLS